MTGYTVHTGASEDFVAGWDRIFGGDSDEPAKKKAKSKAKKKAKPEKKAGKKRSKK